MIEKSDAIIIKSRKFRETSKLLTLYTRGYGKLNMIAKGSRSKNNKYGGSLETLNHISVIFYYYPQKEFHYISQVSINDFFHNIHNDIKKTMIALSIAEILNNTVHTNEKNEALFNLILDVFRALDNSNNDYIKYLVYFQIYFSKIMGYSPNFTFCVMCNKKIEDDYKDDSVYLSFENGSIFCESCKNKVITPLKNCSPKIPAIIDKLENTYINNLSEIKIPYGLLNEVFAIYHKYLKNHLLGMKDLKSLDLYFNIT